MNPAVGIDLGTTNTVVAVQTNDRGPEILSIRQPVDARTEFEERPEIKSAVFFESATSAVVGHYAAQRLEGIRSIKSKMGTRWRIRNEHRSPPLLQRKRPSYLTPAYVSAHILKLAFDSVLSKFPEWDGSAVITVPAAFNTDQRADTLKAAEYAGFGDVELMDEPTAAFYAYFDQFRESDEFATDTTVLVFDFGGGTLDVSIIKVRPLPSGVNIDAIGRSRFNDLGGDDIDLDIAVFMLAVWEEASGNSIEQYPNQLRARLYRRFLQISGSYKERVEELLASHSDPDDFFCSEKITDGKDTVEVQLAKTLTRDQYDLLAGRFLDNKREVNIFRPIEQAFSLAAQIEPSFKKTGLDLVLYTGGASQMHGVRSALQAFFAPTLCVPVGDEGNACRTVALGAAAYRYDRVKRQDSVKMSRRTLEAILTRPSPESGYIEIVPVTAFPQNVFQKVNHRFVMEADAVRVRVPLFRGVGIHDHQLSPIKDVVLELPRLVREGTEYELSYRVSQAKTIDLQARFDVEGDPIEVSGSVPLDKDEDDPADVDLFTINK